MSAPTIYDGNHNSNSMNSVGNDLRWIPIRFFIIQIEFDPSYCIMGTDQLSIYTYSVIILLISIQLYYFSAELIIRWWRFIYRTTGRNDKTVFRGFQETIPIIEIAIFHLSIGTSFDGIAFSNKSNLRRFRLFTPRGKTYPFSIVVSLFAFIMILLLLTTSSGKNLRNQKKS